MIVMMAAARLVHPLLGALVFCLIVVTMNKETMGWFQPLQTSRSCTKFPHGARAEPRQGLSQAKPCHSCGRLRMTEGACMQYDYDLFVIGGGSGGVRAARIAANHGAKVAVAEEVERRVAVADRHGRQGGHNVVWGGLRRRLAHTHAHGALATSPHALSIKRT